jgi:hypothetical protein
MRRKLSTTEKVRRLIDQGYTNKAIIDKLRIKPQAVYNIRYQINKARGLGAIGTPTPTPADGIGAPPKRKYTRRIRAGELASPPFEPANLKEPPQPYTAIMIEPEAKPTLWQRIVKLFKR